MKFKLLLMICLIFGAIGILSCGQLQKQAAQPVEFLAFVMDHNDIKSIIPLGHLNPPAHTFPTDHIYFEFVDPTKEYNVYFPASGEIISIIKHDAPLNDYKIVVKCTDDFSYYLDHIQTLEASAKSSLNVQVSAGQKAGKTGGRGSSLLGAMDLGVMDSAVTLTGFIDPSRYVYGTLHAGAPLSYYPSVLRASLEALVVRYGTNDKNSKIDFDLPGKLIGNWFSSPYSAYSKQMAFVKHCLYATREVISIGSGFDLLGVYFVSSAAMAFEDVSKNTGLVKYQLFNDVNLSTCEGWLIAQLSDDSTVQIEVSSTEALHFSSKAAVYIR